MGQDQSDVALDWESGRSTMSRCFIRDMESLWAELLKFAAVVEETLGRSLQALRDGRADRAQDVKRQRRLVNRWEVQLEQECIRVLALHQPVASDLRRVAAVLRINGDLHRLCDLARHIAKRVKKLAADPQAIPIPQALEDLGVEALDQVHDCLDALTRSSVPLARSVIDADQRIDRDYRAVQKLLKQQIALQPRPDQYPAPAGQHGAEPRADRRPRRPDRRVGHLPRAGRYPPPSAPLPEAGGRLDDAPGRCGRQGRIARWTARRSRAVKPVDR